MFTKNLRFFGQTLHPQWPAQTSKKPEMASRTLGVNLNCLKEQRRAHQTFNLNLLPTITQYDFG
jgi:hypothetical protein